MILIESNDLSIADGWHTESEGVQTIKIRFLWLMKHGVFHNVYISRQNNITRNMEEPHSPWKVQYEIVSFDGEQAVPFSSGKP
jgi:hypothetical protein